MNGAIPVLLLEEELDRLLEATKRALAARINSPPSDEARTLARVALKLQRARDMSGGDFLRLRVEAPTALALLAGVRERRDE